MIGPCRRIGVSARCRYVSKLRAPVLLPAATG